MQLSTNGVSDDKTNLDFNPISFETIEQLKEIVKKDWTPSVCMGGRSLEHFAFSQFLFGDVDNDNEDVSTHVTIDQFNEIFKDYEYYIITSRNHGKDKYKQKNGTRWNSKATDRYHVIFPLESECWDIDWLSNELSRLCETWKFFDNSAKGATRFYFGHGGTDVFYHGGKRWPYEEVIIPQQQATYVPDKNPELEATLDRRILERLVQAYNMGAFASYGEWIRCGQALKASGFTLDDWLKITDPDVSSKQSSNKWNTFKPSKLGKGTLIEYARKSDPDFLRPGSIRNSGVGTNPSSTTKQGPTSSTVPPNKNDDKSSRLSGAPDFSRKADIDIFRHFSSVFKKTPRAPTGEWVKVPKGTIENFEILLAYYRVTIRYNLMAHKSFIYVPGIEGEGNTQNASYGIIISLCKLNGMDIIGQIDSYLNTLGNKNKYHPVKEWIELSDQVWDKEDRFEYLISCIDLADKFPLSNFRLYFRKWLISAIACVFEPSYRGRGVLVFQGDQYQGKSSFIKSLMKKNFEKEWFEEGLAFDPRNKDLYANAISHWICELAELEGIFKRSDNSALRSFLTKESDTLRMPYDRREETYNRRTVFIATVNDPKFISDETGSSRYWTVPINFIHLERLKDFNALQFWLQIKSWYDNKEQWWLTKEQDETLQLYNEVFTENDPYKDKIESVYKIKDINNMTNLRYMTISEISEEIGVKVISKSVSNGIARTLKKMGFIFRRKEYSSGYMMPSTLTASEKDVITNDAEIINQDDIPF